ncbi:hypothetical protein RRG08_029796 [Elysia crispata]|uniref:Uncharacterized protein n=1 Tax=Elysia crispata TaxID=231223 RepID=A0AAE0YLV4_9GAST|nr:hypothetical protein RRG08_029796 [Elysia crispata]
MQFLSHGIDCIIESFHLMGLDCIFDSFYLLGSRKVSISWAMAEEAVRAVVYGHGRVTPDHQAEITSQPRDQAAPQHPLNIKIPTG